MDRRELLKMIAVVTGGAVIGGDFLLTGCKNPESGEVSMVFSEENIAFLDEVAETILPQTSTAGAKAAGVGRFMTVMVNDCYTKADQEVFHPVSLAAPVELLFAGRPDHVAGDAGFFLELADAGFL